MFICIYNFVYLKLQSMKIFVYTVKPFVMDITGILEHKFLLPFGGLV